MRTTGKSRKEECLLSQQDAEKACVVTTGEKAGLVRQVKDFPEFLAKVHEEMKLGLYSSAICIPSVFAATVTPQRPSTFVITAFFPLTEARVAFGFQLTTSTRYSCHHGFQFPSCFAISTWSDPSAATEQVK
jgi:hypothetical protein